MLDLRNSPSGAAFRIDQPVRATYSTVLAQGWEAVLEEQTLIVRGPTHLANYDEALDESLAAAQEALDIIGMDGGPFQTLEGAESDHIVWWSDGNSCIARVHAVTDLPIHMSASTEVRDGQGNLVAQPSRTTPWHPSFRYYRLSQSTSDLFDSYRNLFLALESVLDSLWPQKRRAAGGAAEGERAWFERALSEASRVLDLSPFVPPGTADPVAAIASDLYLGTRTGMFHAKSSRPILLPQAAHDRPQVLASLDRLAKLYLMLVANRLSVARPSGAITYHGFDAMTNWPVDAAITEDDSLPHKDQVVINPTGGGVAVLLTRLAPELGAPGLKFWVGEGPGARIAWPVRKAGLVNKGSNELYVVCPLVVPLVTTGADVLQVQLGVRLVNPSLPRFRFNT